MLFTARRFPFGGRRPVPRRLVKTPVRATLSPNGERGKSSHRLYSLGLEGIFRGLDMRHRPKPA
jgi:hypothetical protein